jgi:hypothetical protein
MYGRYVKTTEEICFHTISPGGKTKQMSFLCTLLQSMDGWARKVQMEDVFSPL